MTTSPEAHKIWDMLGDHAVCMLVTKTGDTMRARPMVALPREDEGLLWFITGKAGHKDDEVLKDAHVCVTYSRPSKNDYLSISGSASIVEDPDKVKALWNEGAKSYFPEGPDSPAVELIRVRPDHGEYWDATGNSALVALKMIEARFAGERPDIGENEKVSF